MEFTDRFLTGIMDDKDVTDDSAPDVPVTIESKADDSVQMESTEIKKSEEAEISIDQENKEPVTVPDGEPMAVEKTEKVDDSENLELEPEKESEKVESKKPAQVEDNAMAVDEPEQPNTSDEQSAPVSVPVTDQLLSVSGDLLESGATPTENMVDPVQDQIVPVQESMMVDNTQQDIPINESVQNNDDVKLVDAGVLDRADLTMKDLDLKDLVMRELSEFLTDDQSQNVVQPLPVIKSEDIKVEEQNKIENLVNTLSEITKTDLKEQKKSENDIADALSTLATAALNQAPPTNGTVDSTISKPNHPLVTVKQEGPAWCDVGVIKGSTCLVKQFYSTSTTDEHENTSLDHLPDYTNKVKIDIQPGTAYKLRIAAVNACGRGEWSEISAFKTCLPGYPGAPSAIKITKAPDGASLTWEAPPSSSGKILEYSVCLAIKNPKEGPPQSPKPTTTGLNFVRVYCGPHNAAVVSHESLGAALIDRTNKPAIIFRIAAKNEKGYGPATQVRWLQDSNVPGSAKNTAIKREKSVNLLTGVPKRPKI